MSGYGGEDAHGMRGYACGSGLYSTSGATFDDPRPLCYHKR
jgi:hypothetical protein